MLKKTLSHKLVFALILISLASGYFWSHKLFGESLKVEGDEISYDRLARSILTSHKFIQACEGITIEQFYPLFLAGIYKVFGHHLDVVRWIQVFLFALTCLLVYFLSKQIVSRKVAFFSALYLALFYPLAGCAGKIYREIFFTFLLVLFISLWYRAWFSQEKKWFIFSGVVLALAILTNAVIFLLPLFFIVHFLILGKKKIFSRKILINFSLFILAVLMIFSFSRLWSSPSDGFVSSVSTSKKGVLLLSRAELTEGLKGETLYHLLGQTVGYFFVWKLNPQILADQIFDVPTKSVESRMKSLSQTGYSSQEIDKIFTKEALIKILNKPHLYLVGGFLNLISYNNPMLPDPKTLKAYRVQNLFINTHPELTDLTKIIVILAVRLIWLMFFFFVIYGLVKAVKKNWVKFSWIILTLLYFNLVYSLLFAIPRYALPIYPFYLLFFAYGIDVWCGSKKYVQT